MMKTINSAPIRQNWLVGLLLLCSCAVAATDQSRIQYKREPGCKLELVLTEIEQVASVSRRLGPSLSALAQYCPGPLGELADVAKRAAEQPDRAKRSFLLAQAANQILSANCQTEQPMVAASTLQPRCPGPANLGLDKPLAPLKDLDAGSYLFILAIQKRLFETYRDQINLSALERILETMILSGALEGCEASQQGCSDLPTVHASP